MKDIVKRRGRPRKNTVIPTPTEKRKPGRPRGSKNKTKGKPIRKKRSMVKTSTGELRGWRNYLVNVNDVICENKPVLIIRERLLVSCGGIVTLTGKPKSCKTFLATGIVGAFLKGEYLNITSKVSGQQAKALIVDTEQGRARTQNVQRRIYAICGYDTGKPDNRLTMLSLREIPTHDRAKMFFEAVNELKPKLIVIDGIRDLIKDFNSIEESAGIVDKLMQVACELDCAIVVVIHQNKGDSNIRGHLGSELCNKSETVVELQRKTNNSVVVYPSLCRDIEFEPFAMRVNECGLPVICEMPAQESSDDLRQLITRAMNGDDTLLRKELVGRIMQINNKSQKTAERRITDALHAELIELLPDGITYQIIADNFE